MKRQANLIFLIMGWLSFILGFIGAFLPIMPTVPFMLLAAYFFSKGSPKIHIWLRSHKKFGQILVDWEDKKVIRRPAKIKSSLLILSSSLIIILVVDVMIPIKIFVCSLMLLAMIFVITRKEN